MIAKGSSGSAEFLAALVRAEVAGVLSYPDPALVAEDDSFEGMGFDSIEAVDLSERLSAAMGIELPDTLVFDYPTPRVLIEHLRTLKGGTEVRHARMTGPPQER